jgi:hypothetical protein
MPQHTTMRRMAPLAKPAPWSSDDDLLYELQSTLRAVADVELRYEIAREGLELSSGPASARQGRVVELEARHRLELEPYAQAR